MLPRVNMPKVGDMVDVEARLGPGYVKEAREGCTGQVTAISTDGCVYTVRSATSRRIRSVESSRVSFSVDKSPELSLRRKLNEAETAAKEAAVKAKEEIDAKVSS